MKELRLVEPPPASPYQQRGGMDGADRTPREEPTSDGEGSDAGVVGAGGGRGHMRRTFTVKLDEYVEKESWIKAGGVSGFIDYYRSDHVPAIRGILNVTKVEQCDDKIRVTFDSTGDDAQDVDWITDVRFYEAEGRVYDVKLVPVVYKRKRYDFYSDIENTDDFRRWLYE
jgi:hypothetical protein